MQFITAGDVYDSGFKMCASLLDWCMSHPEMFEHRILCREKNFVIIKGTHIDGNGEYHFTFSNNGRSFHAYTQKFLIVVNGKACFNKFKIIRVTALEIFY
jgi:hypothetical protein